MPHCLVEGSLTLTQLIEPVELVGLVEGKTVGCGLFSMGELKLRLSLDEHFSVGGSQEDFVHLIFYILAGRTPAQKQRLSTQIVRALVERLPGVATISQEVRDIEREVFSNKRSCLTGSAERHPEGKEGAQMRAAIAPGLR
jgi:5-carboxymethyl-2-hydroxymuconate isomerase